MRTARLGARGRRDDLASSSRRIARPALPSSGVAGAPRGYTAFLLGGGSVGRLPGSAGRWAPGMTQDWTPLAPELVCEVAYDQVDQRRFRHPARFRRWRPDRDPRSCTSDQLEAEPAPVGALLGLR